MPLSLPRIGRLIRSGHVTLDALLPLILFTVVATITPGGATTLATASGINFGFRRSVPLMVGIAIGLASMAALAAAGLAAFLLAFPSLQIAMKAAGTTYLLWLAWRVGRSGPPNMANKLATPTSLIGGIGLLWLNPKAWAMTAGAAASFAALAGGPEQLAVLLGLTFGLAACASLSLWCWLGLLLARLLKRDWQWRALNLALGVLLVVSIVPMWRE